MVIVNNNKEYENHYNRRDRIVVQVSSSHATPLPEILDQLVQGNELPEGVEIHVYTPSFQSLEESYLAPEVPEASSTTPFLTEVIDNEALSELDDDFYERPELFVEFEKFSAGHHGHESSFTEWAPDAPEQERALLIEQISNALDILPSLWNTDLSAEEKIRYSKVGKNLYWNFRGISSSNTYPALDVIKEYDAYTAYEKRAIQTSGVHPMKAVCLKRAFHAARPMMILTKQHITKLRRSSVTEVCNAYLSSLSRPVSTPFFPNGYDEILSAADTAFKAAYRGRSPRVLAEYLDAVLISKGMTYASLTMEDIDQIVKEFNMQSLSKVARYHNLALYALSSALNFNEISQEHIEAFATYIDPSRLKEYADKGLWAWYNANKANTRTTDFMDMLDGINQIEQFDENLSAQQLIFEIGQAKGREEARKMERAYDYSFADNDLAIRGRNIVATQGDLKAYILAPTDFRNFTVGYDTHCCQHYDNAGESCVWKATSDPFAGIFVIERKNKILAQSFIWTDEEKDTLVFDNVEFANDRQVQQFNDLFAVWCQAMPYANIHVGVGYNQGMNGWGKRIREQVRMPNNTLPGPDECSSYYGSYGSSATNGVYSDYHADARALKRNGSMEIYPVRNDLEVTQAEAIPSRWDVFSDPKLAWMSTVNLILSEKLNLAEAFLNDPDPGTQMRAVQMSPAAIRYIEHPTLEAQQYIAAQHKEYMSYIQNPDPLIFAEAVENDPYKILTLQDASPELWAIAVRGNGLLLELCPPQIAQMQQIQEQALRQNGIAIKFISNPAADLQLLAVSQTPLALNFIKRPVPQAILLAAQQDPSLLSRFEPGELSADVQMTIVHQHPIAISYLRSPDPAVVREAVERDGNLIRNFKSADEATRLAAVRQNGLAVRYIPNPSRTVLMEAYRQNPRSLAVMRLSIEEKRMLLAQTLENRETEMDVPAQEI